MLPVAWICSVTGAFTPGTEAVSHRVWVVSPFPAPGGSEKAHR